jgi:hypothetical protein
MDQLNSELDSLQQKIKVNPRSQEVDVLRSKLVVATSRC